MTQRPPIALKIGSTASKAAPPRRRARPPAATPAPTRAPPRIDGFIDGFREPGHLFGWAFVATGEPPIHIELREGDRLLAQTVADIFRPDLLAAGLGDGCCAFQIDIPATLLDNCDHALTIHALHDGTTQRLPEAENFLMPRTLIGDAADYAAAVIGTVRSGNDTARLAALIEACRALLLAHGPAGLRTTGESRYPAALLDALLADVRRCQFDLARLAELDMHARHHLIDLLHDLGEHEALDHILAGMPVRANEHALRHRILWQMFPRHGNAWYAGVDFLHDKRLLNEGFIHEAARQFTTDTTLFTRLKAFECAHLNRHRHWPTVRSLLAHLRAPATTADTDTPAEPQRDTLFDQRALFAQPRILRTITALSLFAPDFLRDLLAHLDDSEIETFLAGPIPGPPVYLIVTNVSYPMGGGESFMYQTCKILSELGFICVWVSFRTAAGDSYAARSETATPYFLDVREPGGLDGADIDALIAHYSADILHTQGQSNAAGLDASQRTRIPLITGFHFWDGLVSLGRGGNADILANITRHRLGPLYQRLQSPLCTAYVASEFMADVVSELGGSHPPQVCHPTSDTSHYGSAAGYDPRARAGVLQLNIHERKGGRQLLAAIEALGDRIPFTVVRSEPNSDACDADIRQAIARSPTSRYLDYGDVKPLYAAARMVLVPTLVDETFCRVAYEAAMCGIPVISTRRGFLPYLLGDSGVFLDDDPDSWVRAIATLYHDHEALARISAAQSAQVRARCTPPAASFLPLFAQALRRAPRRNIGFIAPWSEQGLGIQVRHYAGLLRGLGYRVHVLSFQPYAAIGRAPARQHHPAEWAPGLHADSVHYSLNTREELTNHEITQFLAINNVGMLIYPEVCWQQNWDKIRRISMVNLFTACVPNIETVRRAEVPNHRLFSRILCNTRAVEGMFHAHGIAHTHYIGHGVGAVIPPDAITEKSNALAAAERLRFVHIAGHNPHTRKQTRTVITAFMMAVLQRDDIELIVAVMDNWSNADIDISAAGERIRILNRELSHAEVMALYADAHVSIQVSSHEGLGLGFYESLSALTPVLSLDIAPHNEIVRPGVSGWLLPAERHPLPDNDDAVSHAGLIDPPSLAQAIVDIRREAVAALIAPAARMYNAGFVDLRLQMRLLAGIW